MIAAPLTWSPLSLQAQRSGQHAVVEDGKVIELSHALAAEALMGAGRMSLRGSRPLHAAVE